MDRDHLTRPRHGIAPPARLLSLARAAWGGVLLFAPGQLLRVGGPGFATPRAVAVARVLGARHVAQAAVTALTPTPAVAALGAVVDGLHAGGNVVIAAASARWRRTAAIDAAIAAAFAATGWALSGSEEKS